MLKGIIFDMDGTLTLSNHFHARSFDLVIQKFGRTVSDEEYFDHLIGRGAKEILSELLKGLVFDLEECVKEKKKIFREIVLNEKEMPVVPGIKEFLEYCKQQKWLLAVASGSSLESMELVLKQAGLLNSFNGIFSAMNTKKNKPAPDVYLEALRGLGLESDEVLVFEDSVAGVESAVAAGLRCIGLQTTTEPKLLEQSGVAMLIHDYAELLEIQKINQNVLTNILNNNT
jgi:beta-phosphoglucomutase